MEPRYTFTGADLKELRTAFGLRQVEISTDCGVSWPTVQRAEGRPRDRISELFSIKLDDLLLTSVDLGLLLGLTSTALERASETGLRSWHSINGTLYWRPHVNSWLRQMLKQTPYSARELAIELCAALKVSKADGLLFCQECESRQARGPRLAHRRCGQCQKPVCEIEVCSSRAAKHGEWINGSTLHLCSECLSRDPHIMKAANPYMPLRDLDRPYLQLSEKLKFLKANDSGKFEKAEFGEQIEHYVQRLNDESVVLRSCLSDPTSEGLNFELRDYLEATLRKLEEEKASLTQLTESL